MYAEGQMNPYWYRYRGEASEYSPLNEMRKMRSGESATTWP